MHLLVRAVMAASLIIADAAQAASVSANRGGRAAEDETTTYGARLQRILDRDERNWRRLSASICVGCGSPPSRSEIADATPLYIQARRDAAAAVSGPEVAKPKSPVRTVSLRSAVDPREEERNQAVRSKPRSSRTATARRSARYAHRRMIRHQRRLALLRAQKRKQAAAVLARNPPVDRIKVAALETGTMGNRPFDPGRERRPIPLPPPRPDALCADDRRPDARKARLATACADFD